MALTNSIMCTKLFFWFLLISGTITEAYTPDSIKDILQTTIKDIKRRLFGIVTFSLYNREFQNVPYKFSPDSSPADMILRNPIKIIIHGYKSNANASWVQEMKDEYIENGNYNIITVDWSRLALKLYSITVLLAKPIAEFVAKFIIYLHRVYNVPYRSFHLIGHSLGAHMAGFTGKYILDKEKHWLGRISGLDPAGPFFYNKSRGDRLSKWDAYFVDVIHTDGNMLGYYAPIGHADFYPNGGVGSQPGCEDSRDFESCSHERSALYFIESINSNQFIAHQCESYTAYINYLCMDNNNVIMGENVDKNARGSFFLMTNNEDFYTSDW